MATHFSTIGLPISTDNELIELIERVMTDAERFPTPQGTYLRWADASGAELWIQLNSADELVGVNPHFGGRSRVRVLLTDRLDAGNTDTLDGRFHGWADPERGEREQSGAYPFLFDAPDAACHAGLELPVEIDVQIAAFAHDLQVYANPKVFEATQTGDVWHTSRTFIPTGLRGGDGPRAEAAFTGHVQRAERRTNKLTGHEFVWCLVHSTGGTFDIVADPELLPTPPPVGGVVTGTFWLTGRVGACAPVTQLQASEGWKRAGRSGRA